MKCSEEKILSKMKKLIFIWIHSILTKLKHVSTSITSEAKKVIIEHSSENLLFSC